MLLAVCWQSLPIHGIFENQNREKTGEQIIYQDLTKTHF